MQRRRPARNGGNVNLSSTQVQAVNRLKRQSEVHYNVCLIARRRWGKTRLAQAVYRNPSLLGQAWSDLDAVAMVQLSRPSDASIAHMVHAKPVGPDKTVGFIIDNSDSVNAAGVRQLISRCRKNSKEARFLFLCVCAANITCSSLECHVTQTHNAQ